jgi:hypothetical protein
MTLTADSSAHPAKSTLTITGASGRRAASLYQATTRFWFLPWPSCLRRVARRHKHRVSFLPALVRVSANDQKDQSAQNTSLAKFFSGYSVIGDIFLGILSAVIDGFILRQIGFAGQEGLIYTILVAAGGPVLTL